MNCKIFDNLISPAVELGVRTGLQKLLIKLLVRCYYHVELGVRTQSHYSFHYFQTFNGNLLTKIPTKFSLVGLTGYWLV